MSNIPNKKLIFFANVNGAFEKLIEIYNKVTEKSGEFNLIILTGYVFNKNKSYSLIKELDKLKTKVLIFDQSEVGIITKHKIFNEHYHLSENVTILGRSGIYTYEDIKIAYVNGKEQKKYLSEDDKYKYTSSFFSRDDLNYVITNSEKIGNKVDILLINTIPNILFEEMKNSSTSPLNSNTLKINKDNIKDYSSLTVNLIMKKIKPRYTITSIDDFYYERKPFINSEKYLSRFINIANFPGEMKVNLKEKFLYALSIKPINKMFESELYDVSNVESTPDIFKDTSNDINSLFIVKSKYTDKNFKVSTEEIYVGNLDRGIIYEDLYEFLKRFGEVDHLNMITDNRNKFQGYAFVKYKNPLIHEQVIKHSNEYSIRGRKVIISEKLEKQVTLEDIEKRCWFCFNNPSIESDLILTEFREFYLAYPKGPIDLFHLLILPKKHIASFLDLNKTQKEEFIDILTVLTKMLADNSMDYLIYEKNLPYKDIAARHMIINIIGIAKEYTFSFCDHMQEVFSKNKVIYREFDSNKSISEIVGKDSFYHYIDAPNGIQFGRSNARTKVIVEVRANDKDKKEFQDYTRIILCNLLEKEERINWKNSELNKEFLVSLKDKLIKYFK